MKKLTKKQNDYFYHLFEYKSIRTYLDFGSSEFQKKNIYNKLGLLTKIIDEGNTITDLVNYFNSIYFDNNKNYLHLKGCIEETLMQYVLFIETGKWFSLTPKKYENLSIYKIIALFETRLQEYKETFSIQKLVESYINNTDEYKKLSDFLNVDLDSDITKKLEQRDLDEKIKYPYSYVHLYNFLNRNVFPAIKENNYDFYFMIDMGCSSNVLEYLIQFKNETEFKENNIKRSVALKIAIDIVSILHKNKR